MIVGEVLGPEVVEMLSAMSQGNDGSLSTIHARDSEEVFNRVATYAAQFEPPVLDPIVKRLVELAGGGPALEFAVGTGRTTSTPARVAFTMPASPT